MARHAMFMLFNSRKLQIHTLSGHVQQVSSSCLTVNGIKKKNRNESDYLGWQGSVLPYSAAEIYHNVNTAILSGRGIYHNVNIGNLVSLMILDVMHHTFTPRMVSDLIILVTWFLSLFASTSRFLCQKACCWLQLKGLFNDSCAHVTCT